MKHAPITHEHDFETVRGVPGTLPPGETLLWQGAPTWWGLALRVFHFRKVAIYFALLLAWRIVVGIENGEPFADILASLAMMLPFATAGLAILALLAWMYAKTTVYTITTERILLRCGLAFTLTANLPLNRVRKADLRICGDGSGDIALDFMGPYRVSYVYLWPFVRPWKLARPQPLLRAVHGPQAIAELMLKVVNGDAVEPFPQEQKDGSPDLAPAPAPAE